MTSILIQPFHLCKTTLNNPKMSRFLLNIVALALIIFTFEKSIVLGLEPGRCHGMRLDTLARDTYMKAGDCVDLGGTCCGFYNSVEEAHEDPRTMDRNDFCYTCYDSGTKLTCGGNLLRKKVVRDKSSWVTAKSCIDMYGMCCMGNATSGNPAIFDPRKYPNAYYCNNCYVGGIQTTASGPAFCHGALVDSVDYKAKTCTQFDGNCCDNDVNGGSAFDPWTYNFREDACDNCYSGYRVIQK